MPVHTIGDSHSRDPWNLIPGVTVHHVGPKLCFSVGRDGISLEGVVSDGDTINFCFGEIDCRCHVHKHVSESTSFKVIIDSLVDAYVLAIKCAVSKFPNLRTAIYNAVPPTRKGWCYENPQFPLLGTDEERRQYTLYFNEKVEAACASNGFLYFNIYSHYTDFDGYLLRTLSDGNVHIKDPKYIQSFLSTHIPQADSVMDSKPRS